MSHGETRVYVGNLPPDIRTRDIEDLFYKFGRIGFIDLKNRKGPPFAFVEFEDSRDAEDAVYSRDGYDYDGYRLRVEFPRSNRSGYRNGFGGRGSSQRFNKGGPSRRSQWRLFVSGLPQTGSWQDLKDHMRQAGEVCFSDVYNDGTGTVEFLHESDMIYAIKKLDDSKFRSHEGETSYIHVSEDAREGRAVMGGGRSRSCSPRYSDHRSRSRSRSRGYY